MWLRILVLALSLGFAIPAAVFAQDDSARAIELITEGNAAYERGDFRAALQSYRGAYAVTEDPRVLYRIGLTYENLANYQRAREHLELYLLAEPNSQYAARVKSKIDSLRNLEANLQAAVRVETQPPGASIWVDIETGRPSGIAPVRLPLGPGQHTLLIRKEGFEDVRDTIDVGTGETLQKTYDLGNGAAVQEPVVVAEQPVTPVEEATPAPTDLMLAGRATQVRIGPSPGITALSWICMGLGWALVATSGVGTQLYFESGVIGAGFLAGAGLITLGGYFLWFRDYSADLPPATSAHLLGAPAQRTMGIGLRF